MLADHYWADPAGTRHIVSTEPKTVESPPFTMCNVAIVIPTNSWDDGWCVLCVLRASAVLEVPHVVS